MGGQVGGPGVQRRRHRAVGGHPPGGVQHDQPVDVLDPRPEPVLDEHHGGSGLPRGVGDRPAYGLGGVGVQHRGGLVEQDQARAQREDAGQGEPLRLTAGEGVDGMVRAVGEAHGREGVAHGGPDPVPGQPEVLRPERDVAPDPPGDRRVGRVLHEQAHVGAAVARVVAVDPDRAAQVTALGRREDAGQRAQQGGLARAARPGEQDPLTGKDREVEAGQDRRGPAERPPDQPVDLDARTGGAPGRGPSRCGGRR